MSYRRLRTAQECQEELRECVKIFDNLAWVLASIGRDHPQATALQEHVRILEEKRRSIEYRLGLLRV